MITRGEVDPSFVEEMSRKKKEPEWMRRFRLRALEQFREMKDPLWLRGVEEIDLGSMILYEDVEVRAGSWDELPEDIRRFYEEVNLPEVEKRFLAGLTASFDSETVYARAKEILERAGVILLPMDEAVKRYPELVRRYFGRVMPPTEHRYAALHYALWSGGAFLYVPDGVRIDVPVEAFFLISEELTAQFEHTLVVVGKNASIHFIEGCSSPQFRRFSFHNGMVEAYVHEGGHLKFTTVQNWGRNIVNFNSKRAVVEKGGRVEWMEGAFGSRSSYVYPSVVLQEGASARISGFTVAHPDEWKEGGAKVFHVGRGSRSSVTSKSISVGNGVTVFRGLVKVNRGAENAVSTVSCDSLLMDPESRSFTYPHTQVEEETAKISYEARAWYITADQLFYLATRGLDEDRSRAYIALGFLSDIVSELPPEYSAVFRRVLEYDFGGSVG